MKVVQIAWDRRCVVIRAFLDYAEFNEYGKLKEYDDYSV